MRADGAGWSRERSSLSPRIPATHFTTARAGAAPVRASPTNSPTSRKGGNAQEGATRREAAADAISALTEVNAAIADLVYWKSKEGGVLR